MPCVTTLSTPRLLPWTILQQDGIPLSVILVMDISHGADVIMARSGIAGMGALKGLHDRSSALTLIYEGAIK